MALTKTDIEKMTADDSAVILFVLLGTSKNSLFSIWMGLLSKSEKRFFGGCPLLIL